MKSFWLLILLSSVSFAGSSQYQVIETFGDSLTAGFLSDTSLTEYTSAAKLSGIITNLTLYIATAQESHFKKLHHPSIAWPSQLKKLLDIEILDNWSVSRARTKDLVHQINRVRAQEEKKVIGFIFIGHNDLCHSQDDVEQFYEKFYKELNESLATWDKKRSHATMYLMPVGDVHRLYETIKDFEWFKTEKITLSCLDSWDRVFPFCPENTQRRKQGILKDYLTVRIERIQKSLSELAQYWNKNTVNSNHFNFLEGLLSQKYLPDYFAIDCYHLSKLGHEALAKHIFKTIQN